jgi:hypothetical protein
MSPNFDDDQLDQWQGMIDDIHGDIDLEDPMLDIEVDHATPGGEMEVTEITVVRPILADSDEDPIEATRRIDRADGGQIAVTIRRQLRCPSCHYIPQYGPDEYDEPPEVKGWCRDCETLTCTECRVEASCCQRDLCSDCSEAFITEDGPLCRRHRQDAVEERNFQRNIELREQKRKDRELQLRYELQYLKLELNARIKEQQQRLQAFVEQWKQIDRITNRQIEKKRVELGHMLDRRKQALQEFQTAATVQLKREAQALDENRLDFEREKHRDKQSLKEQQQDFKQYIEEERLKIRKAEVLLRAENSDARGKIQGIKKAAKQLDGMNSTPAITV